MASLSITIFFWIAKTDSSDILLKILALLPVKEVMLGRTGSSYLSSIIKEASGMKSINTSSTVCC